MCSEEGIYGGQDLILMISVSFIAMLMCTLNSGEILNLDHLTRRTAAAISVVTLDYL